MSKNLQTNSLIYFGLNFSFLVALLALTIFFWTSLPLSAQQNDAIAIQVRVNPDRYSALRWYTVVKEFTGTPQALTVDGYEAIRDGRTVYVNAGNYKDGKDYANIYLISYSQESAPGTVDVFADMLKHWTFNTNLISDDPANYDYGTCEISTFFCTKNSDCKKGYECRTVAKGTKPADNKCHLEDEENQTCWRDKDCPKGIFCSGKKATITRKTIRYANLVDIRTMISDFYNTSKYYPKLAAGTYLPGISLSTWPSWNTTLALEIGAGTLPLDPINIMGACASTIPNSKYDPKTCWDDVTKSFGGSFGADKRLVEPNQSFIYGYNEREIYSVSPDGKIYCPLDGSACY
jgi:hypothetical protein